MIRTISLSLISTLVLIPFQAEANISKTNNAAEAVYCPSKITCNSTQFKDCKFANESDAKYWDIQSLGNTVNKVKPGNYHFTEANPHGCEFSLDNTEDVDANEVISLDSKFGANIMPKIDSDVSWDEEEMEFPICDAADAKACPFQADDVVSFFVKTKNTVDIAGFVNQNPIKKDTIPSLQPSFSSEELATACGSAKECKIDVVLTPISKAEHTTVGNVVVSMDDLKIKAINNLPNSHYKINQIENYNSIVVVDAA